MLMIFLFPASIVETLEPFLVNQELAEISNLSEFPDDITLMQTVAAWKHIAAFRNKHVEK